MGKYKPTIVYNVLSNDHTRDNRKQRSSSSDMSIDDMQYSLIDSKGEANEAVQSCLQEAAHIRKKYAKDPNQRENSLNELAERFVRAFASSLDAAEQARLFYNPPKSSIKPSPMKDDFQRAASSWYKRFKYSSLKYRHLW